MKVRIVIAVFILCFSLIGCTSSHSIYYTNTKAVKKEIESINGCGDLLEQVKHNFFLNKKDSVYFENFGFFAHGIGADYQECLKQLDRAQIISIFGVPHFEKDSTLYYVGRKQNSIYQYVQCYTFKPNDSIPFNLQYIWIDEEYTNSDINNLLENTSLKKANFIKRSNTYNAIENKNLRANCLEEKTFLNDKVYYNKKKSTIFLISFSLIKCLVWTMRYLV